MSPFMPPSELLGYLASLGNADEQNARNQLPPLKELSKTLGMSIAKLREQLEVARTLGLVEVRPRTGIRRLPYTFMPAVTQSLSYAVALEWNYFELFSDLRTHIEAAYFHQAVKLLTPEDKEHLRRLVTQAREKLRGHPIQIPFQEHRELHLSIYRRLENPFVYGLLEAYWEMYKAVGFNLYSAHDYLEQVWNYHQRIVEGICSGDVDSAYQAQIEHTDLFYQLPRAKNLTKGTSGE
jgi:DNA-binding FadR family transcriptional regulator